LAALSQSLFLIEQTALDVVDMETRMQNESRKLADLLDELEEQVHAQFFIKNFFENQLVALESEAQSLAAGLFPSGVQGLNKVNAKLWEFTNLQMIIYRDTLKREQENLSTEARQSIESRFRDLRQPFDDLNEFLNELALRSLDAGEIEESFSQRTAVLTAARNLAKDALARQEFGEFRSILKASIDIAESLQESLRAVRVPVFPEHSDLQELRDSIPDDSYTSLTGLEAFALLNIAARMRSLALAGVSMLSPEFEIRIFDVFPDRIYFQAKESLIQSIAKSGLFVRADASLHKFRAGSFKQNTLATGNLQLSFSEPTDGRINVDADIDLYRNPLLHLFGEVLRNHLTGQKTDAYKVRRILDEQNVLPIGGFRIFGA
jgi:hypothetical protein